MLSTIFFAILVFALGALICFMGYRAFMVLLPIWGFLAGMWLGAYVTALIFGTGLLSTLLGIVVAVIAGIASAAFAYLFYSVGVVVVAVLLGAALGSGIMGAVGLDGPLMSLLGAFIGGGAVGAVALLWNVPKYLILVLTALAGADLMVVSGLTILGRISAGELEGGGNLIRLIGQGGVLAWIVALALAVAGFVVQLRASRDFQFGKERFVENWG
jgi:hypothetical protein